MDRKLGSSLGGWVDTTEKQSQYILLADRLQKLCVFGAYRLPESDLANYVKGRQPTAQEV